MNIFAGKNYLPLKRFIDIIGSLIALLAFSPVIIFIAWKVRKNLGSPVLYTQKRPGKDGKIFKMYKFRSMKDALDANGLPLPDDQRLTPFGEKLRSSSLDELPELFNVLKGDMSLIGPRPLLVQYLPLYNDKQRRRHDVRPGITGWAQVNGRNAISWEEKFKLDVWYVENLHLPLDFKILYLTIVSVFTQRDINNSTDNPMPDFTGTQEE